MQLSLKHLIKEFSKWHFHKCFTESDNDGVWGQCIICHKRFGYVDRKTLRAYIDREIKNALER
jgi:hypothetical protein